jgi:hypothetical protein
MTLKWVLRNENGRPWNGFIYLIQGHVGRNCEKIMEFWVTQNVGNFLSSAEIVSF